MRGPVRRASFGDRNGDCRGLGFEFAWSYQLPVEIRHVIAALRDLGVTDEINTYRDEHLDHKLIQGYFARWVKVGPDMDRHYISDVTFAANEDDPLMEKLVCCKELLHILDPEFTRVRSETELEQLIKEIIIPSHLQSPFEESAPTLTDRIAEIQAVAVMFPFNARNVLLEKYKVGKLTLEEISMVSEIPVHYVSLVMSDILLNVYKRLLPGRP